MTFFKDAVLRETCVMKNNNTSHTHNKKRTFTVAFAWILIFAICVGTVYRGFNVWYSMRLEEAIRANDVELAKTIIDDCPSCMNHYPGFLPLPVYWYIDIPRDYPLNVAVEEDNIDMVKLLVEAGADVNCNDGSTPLQSAYFLKPNSWYQISCYLIENGADINYPNVFDRGKTSVLEDIISRGNYNDNIDEINAAFNYAFDRCDHTRVYWPRVLYEAVSYRRFEITEILLSAGVCNVNEMFGDTTALMAATGKTKFSSVLDPDLVRLLLDYGADVTIQDDEGFTAYDYAVRNGFKEAVEMLSDKE